MSDTTDTTTDTTTDGTTTDTTTTTTTEVIEGADQLGDAGKKALDSMKGQRNAARQELQSIKDQLAALQAERDNSGKSPEEQQLDQARKDGETKATQRFNELLVGAELRAAAKGKLADPSDASLYLKLSDFQVSENGTVDADALNEAIDDLLTRKPHLAAEPPSRFQGDAGQGNRGDKPKPQVTEAELKSMTPAQINAARRDGRLDKALGVSS
ncbi:hypothetical protein [Curtobacterium sp. BRD11]|uniref:hypothetical protein n=1 Tax=Curtobacterium sp. BRD11 TaxID=2962581 RepID=UPI0028826E14|nr:hypothetical protein [Curtobacterium sp. BRD11]MDT0211235.1 hypothetical protein [Curtobacterium sp. BRD11]